VAFGKLRCVDHIAEVFRAGDLGMALMPEISGRKTDADQDGYAIV
jgi:hypothetical protein